jgi:hypothetical protein
MVNGDLLKIASRVAQGQDEPKESSKDSKLPDAKKLVDKHIKETFRELGPLALSGDDAKALKEHVKKQWGIK